MHLLPALQTPQREESLNSNIFLKKVGGTPQSNDCFVNVLQGGHCREENHSLRIISMCMIVSDGLLIFLKMSLEGIIKWNNKDFFHLKILC